MSCRQNKGWHYFHLFCGSWTQKHSPSGNAEESPHWRVYLKAGSLGSDDHPASLEWESRVCVLWSFSKGFWPVGQTLEADSRLPTLGSRITSLLSNQALRENQLQWFLFAELNSWLGIAVSSTLNMCIRSRVLRTAATQMYTGYHANRSEEICNMIFQLSGKFCNYQYSFHVVWEFA